jgi:hypothetical protein
MIFPFVDIGGIDYHQLKLSFYMIDWCLMPT